MTKITEINQTNSHSAIQGLADFCSLHPDDPVCLPDVRSDPVDRREGSNRFL